MFLCSLFAGGLQAIVLARAAVGEGDVKDRWPDEPAAYPLYPGRGVHVLNGTWEFAFLGDSVALTPIVPQPPAWQKVLVPDAFDLRSDLPRCSECWPSASDKDGTRCQRCCDRAFGQSGQTSCWDEVADPPLGFERCCGQDPLRYNRGVGAYRAEVQVPPSTAAVLLFGGCSFRCLIAVDGSFLADHSGLSPFSVNVPASMDAGLRSRTVLVLADNRFDVQTHPVHQPKYDWYQAGGILRAVQFHTLPTAGQVYLAAVEVWPRSLREVDVDVGLSFPSRDGMYCRWRFDDEQPATSCSITDFWGLLDPALGLQGVEVPGAKPWTLSSPSLHRMKVALFEGDRMLDCVEVRFGLRTVATRGRDILLNGEPIKLLGFNRHDMTDTPVLSYGDLVKDVMILKAGGANFVRGAHYAQDQRFLDLCDIHGLLVWEEVLGWQNSVTDFGDGIFMMQTLKMADEMAAASANHPSVIFFGFFNEGDSGDGSRATAAAYSTMAQRLRERSGRTRLVSWGSNAGTNDLQFKHADVVAIHDYSAWYPTTRPADMEEVQQIPYIYEAYGRWVEEQFPDKPFMVTEAGAGGIFGRHGPSDVKWTEEYQSLLMQMHLLSALQNKRVAGLSLWMFADTPIDRNVSDAEHRPGGLNNKGIVGLNRLPKAAFQAIRLLLTEQQENPEAAYVGLVLPEEDADRLAGQLRL